MSTYNAYPETLDGHQADNDQGVRKDAEGM